MVASKPYYKLASSKVNGSNEQPIPGQLYEFSQQTNIINKSIGNCRQHINKRITKRHRITSETTEKMGRKNEFDFVEEKKHQTHTCANTRHIF